MKLKRPDTHPQRLNIIPLIDVVFMLLAFLLMTFKIGSPEGDFEANLSHAGGGKSVVEPSADQPVEPLRVRMISDGNGNLVNIKTGDHEFGPDLKRLRNHVVDMLENCPETRRKQMQAEIEFDRLLRYQYTMDAISAVRGYFSGNDFVPLIENINVKECQ